MKTIDDVRVAEHKTLASLKYAVEACLGEKIPDRTFYYRKKMIGLKPTDTGVYTAQDVEICIKLHCYLSFGKPRTIQKFVDQERPTYTAKNHAQ